jgi:hypothetical protein
MYKITRFNDEIMIYNPNTGRWFPACLDDKRYLEYLKWLQQGNRPEIIEK